MKDVEIVEENGHVVDAGVEGIPISVYTTQRRDKANQTLPYFKKYGRDCHRSSETRATIWKALLIGW